MLDDFAVHVADVEAAVGGVDEIDGAAPEVVAGAEVFCAIDLHGFEGDAVGDELHAVEEIAGDIGDEGEVAVFGRVGIAAIDGDAGRGGDDAGAD